MPATPPSWFLDAVAAAPSIGNVTVEGAAIRYSAWGERARPGIVFVHGGGANAAWWEHIAPWFAHDFRVLAVDLSGHGYSDHRGAYSLETWTDEVRAVIQHGGVSGPPIIVGHSMGGFVTIAAAARFGDELAGVIVCDSPVTEPDPELSAPDLQRIGPDRLYATLDEAVKRFRTVPPQATYLDYVIDHIARRSLSESPDGFRWKFDRAVFTQFAQGMRPFALPYLREVRTRFALIASEHGLVTPDIGAFMYEALGRVAPVVVLPDAGHHAMLDQPLALVAALRTLLADWQHSDPRGTPPVSHLSSV